MKKFTLIELLVVIALFGILVSILLPSLSKAKKSASSTVCKSNERQIFIGVSLFQDDNGGAYPQGKNKRFWWLGKKGTVYLREPAKRPLNLYLGGPYEAGDEVPVAHCPEDSGDNSRYNTRGSSYGGNLYKGFGIPKSKSLYWQAADGDKPLTRDSVDDPVKFVLLSELSAFYSGLGTQNLEFSHDLSAGPYSWNLLHADGHITYQQVLTGRTDTETYTFLRN